MGIRGVRSYICETVTEERRMNLLKPIGVFGLAAGLVLAGHTDTTSAQSNGAGLAIRPVSDAALTAPTRSVSGTVKSMVGRMLMLDIGRRDMAFLVDENTEVVARGAVRPARMAGGTLPLTGLVRSGDVARVQYRELDGAMRVSEIRLGGKKQFASR